MWRLEKHPKIWFIIYLLVFIINIVPAIWGDGWLQVANIVCAVLMGLGTLIIGISIIVARYSGKNT